MKSTQLALKAVSIRRTCGRYAASRFAAKHGISGLYRLALQLEASAQFNVGK